MLELLVNYYRNIIHYLDNKLFLSYQIDLNSERKLKLQFRNLQVIRFVVQRGLTLTNVNPFTLTWTKQSDKKALLENA